MSNNPIRQMAQRNMQNLLSIQKIKEYALLTIRYADEAMLDNKEIGQILYSKDLKESEKAEEILALFERRELNDHINSDPDCEFEASLLCGLRRVKELAVGISSGNYAEKELISNESF